MTKTTKKTTKKTKLVVLGNHTIAYIDPRVPDTANVLRSRITMGSPCHDFQTVPVTENMYRLATPQDFKKIGLTFTSQGYANRKFYEYAD